MQSYSCSSGGPPASRSTSSWSGPARSGERIAVEDDARLARGFTGRELSAPRDVGARAPHDHHEDQHHQVAQEEKTIGISTGAQDRSPLKYANCTVKT